MVIIFRTFQYLSCKFYLNFRDTSMAVFLWWCFQCTMCLSVDKYEFQVVYSKVCQDSKANLYRFVVLPYQDTPEGSILVGMEMEFPLSAIFLISSPMHRRNFRLYINDSSIFRCKNGALKLWYQRTSSASMLALCNSDLLYAKLFRFVFNLQGWQLFLEILVVLWNSIKIWTAV